MTVRVCGGGGEVVTPNTTPNSTTNRTVNSATNSIKGSENTHKK